MWPVGLFACLALVLRGAEVYGLDIVDSETPRLHWRVNGARGHFQMAVDDLKNAGLRWGSLMEELITHRHEFIDFDNAFDGHGPEEIKVIVEWHHPERAA